jgi:hypothetical protein
MNRFILIKVLIILVTLAGLSLAGIPQLINYQGMLTDNSGNPLNGSYNITFRIYDDPSAGTKKWEETQSSVSVTNGLFNVILGSVTPINLDFSQDYWLDITVSGETMPTRLRFTSVGYAYRAERADTADYARGGGGGTGSPWVFRLTDGNDTTITTGGRWGIARYGNTLYGNADSTHVNLGVGSTTGASGHNYKYCTVGGGVSNSASEDYTTIGGGINNTASFAEATVGGGTQNNASGQRATIGGGLSNIASANGSTVGGGIDNIASQFCATVAGGNNNSASGQEVTIGGGYADTASGNGATIAGGFNNKAINFGTTVGGGGYNTASEWYATIPGGFQDSAAGYCSFAAGRRAKALHAGSFVWADSTNADFSSSNDNEFAVRASGGMRVISKSNAYGGYLDNQAGGGDGFRAYANVSKGSNWGAVYAINYGSSPAIYADGGDTAAYFNGSVVVTGTLYKGSLAFVIDHPLDPENKYLYHSGVESPDMKNVYDGVVMLGGNGEAWVDLPEWFEALNKDYRYQLTCLGVFAPVYIAQKITDHRFKIAGGQPGMEVSWQVTGIRQDHYAEKHRIQVEEEKSANERGKYLHPDAYNLPETMGINYTDKEQRK